MRQRPRPYILRLRSGQSARSTTYEDMLEKQKPPSVGQVLRPIDNVLGLEESKSPLPMSAESRSLTPIHTI